MQHAVTWRTDPRDHLLELHPPRPHELIGDAAAVVRDLGASYVKPWPGQDGWDYPFQVDHHALWKNSLDGVGALAQEHPDLRFVIEYKSREPR